MSLEIKKPARIKILQMKAYIDKLENSLFKVVDLLEKERLITRELKEMVRENEMGI